MITLKDMAKQCGVSTATISNVLSGKPNVSETTRKQILEVVREAGYQPNYLAQSMRKKRTRTIGIITEDIKEFSTPPIVESIMACCEEYNYRNVIINLRLYDRWRSTWYNDNEKVQSVLQPALNEMLSIKVDGLIYVAGHCRRIEYFDDNSDMPVVIAYALSSKGNQPSVSSDDEAGGYEAARYLMSMGHKKIGVIAGAPDNLHTQDRNRGYQRALFEEKILFDPELVEYGNWSSGSGYELAEALISKGVTAIFCMNDRMAAGVYDYCFEEGITVGRDIGVIGYDNVPMCDFLRPSLSSVEIPLKTIGERATKLLLEGLDQNEVNLKKESIRIPGKLALRASVNNLQGK